MLISNLLHGPFVYNMLWLCVYSLRMSMKIHFSILEFRPEPIARREGVYDQNEEIMT